MNIHGFELTTEWSICNCGEKAKGKKGGKLYFLKKYRTPVAPVDNGTLDAKTFAKNLAKFNEFYSRRKGVNEAIRSIAGPGGNIIVPSEEFIYENQYVEAAEFIPGAVDDKELERVLSGLSMDTKKLLMQTAAGALHSVHSKGVIHSDLKLPNVLLVKNSAGNYVAKLIDFDCAYFEDSKPAVIGGDIVYYSPELGIYGEVEDDREEMAKNISYKSDVFSLGLIYHFYLSGSLPTPVDLPEKLRRRQEKGKPVYIWAALYGGARLELSPSITDPKYVSLINDMLSYDPKDRPTALEVLQRLKADGKSTGATTGGGTKVTGGSIPAEGFCEPWPEHKIVFSADKLKSRGYVSCKQTVLAGVKGYTFYKGDGSSAFMKLDNLLAMNYAFRGDAGAAPGKEEKITVSSGMCEPWPEHRIVFDSDAITAKKIVEISQETLAGVKGYKIIFADGTNRFMRVEMLLNQRIAKTV